MFQELLDLEKFEVCHEFYGSLDLMVTIKSFDLQSIRKRYVQSRLSKFNKTGSVSRRPVGVGGIARIQIRNGAISHYEILQKMKEPRGIAYRSGVLAIASEDTVYFLTDTTLKKLNNPWFSYIHSVDFSPFENRALISSSGLDCLFEYELDEFTPTFDWFAWDNGYDKGVDPETLEPLVITRHFEQAECFKRLGTNHLFIKDPRTQHLPTAKRAAFINSVTYDPVEKDKIIATFFHKGLTLAIDRTTGHSEPIIKDLVNPHGGRRVGDTFFATSTAEGSIVFKGPKSGFRVGVFNLPGKPSVLGDMEWIQNCISHKGTFIAIDSNRNSFIVFDIENRLVSQIKFDSNWAIQDLVALDEPNMNFAGFSEME